MITVSPSRPILHYHGGKWMLAPWIISHFPAHRIYVEPYGGAGSVLLRKERSYSEIWNDLDGEIHNLFVVARERRRELIQALYFTPFSRREYALSFEIADDPLEAARRTFVRSYMGFGSNSIQRSVKSGFRSNSNRSGTTPARDWKNFPEALESIIDRLRGVTLENRQATEIMERHDSTETLHYCDPPYVHSSRTAWAGNGARKGYSHEMSDADHVAMAQFLATLKGKVIVSGYRSPLYDGLFADWRRIERAALADGARKRTECLWFNFQP